MSKTLPVVAVTYRRSILATMIATVLVAGVPRAQVTTPRLRFSEKDFEQSLTNAVGPNVIGYQVRARSRTGRSFRRKPAGLPRMRLTAILP